MIRPLLRISVLVSLASSATLAHGEETKAAGAIRDRNADQYGYVFPDDPLSTLGRDANSVVLIVHYPIRQPGLIRPRLHFVPELLKSIENI